MCVSVLDKLTVDIIYSGIDQLPKKGEEVHSRDFNIQLGGGPVALPIVLKRLNINTKLGTYVGNDFISLLACDLLNELGFNDYYKFQSNLKKPIIVTSVISLNDDRSFITFEDKKDEISYTEQEVYDFLTGSKVCFAIRDYPEVMAELKKEGTTLIFDINWDLIKPISKYRDILDCVEVFTPSDKEAMAITDTFSPIEAVKILAEYVKYPVVTIGKEGCLTYINGKVVLVGPPSYAVETIDTTGAGDNFLAGLTYGIYKDWCIEDCMKMGNIIGANSTTELGCYKAYMSEEEALSHFYNYI
ncbi:MAG TPA: carbohydrate kinase family protein [Victivallales bacterium]|nr:carbohydrate kinase family protein [Victivallales bacterium]